MLGRGDSALNGDGGTAIAGVTRSRAEKPARPRCVFPEGHPTAVSRDEEGSTLIASERGSRHVMKVPGVRQTEWHGILENLIIGREGLSCTEGGE